MTHNRSQNLADILRSARQRKQLSARELGTRVGIAHSNIVRLEQGNHAEPKPQILAALARELDLDLADLYALAGYDQPTELPTFSPYLRSKYGDLPAAAQRELNSSFEAIAKKYGYDANGPAPGEDES